MIHNDKTIRRLGWTGVGLGLAYALVIVYTFRAAMPFNPVKLPVVDDATVKYLIPEGWAFFTRDPLEEALFSYRLDSDGRWQEWAPPNATAGNVFGASRRSRARNIEIGRLIYGLPSSAWSKCDTTPIACLQAGHVAASFDNTATVPLACGMIGLSLQAPIPWAWAAHRRQPMRSTIVKLEVKCDDKNWSHRS